MFWARMNIINAEMWNLSTESGGKQEKKNQGIWDQMKRLNQRETKY